MPYLPKLVLTAIWVSCICGFVPTPASAQYYVTYVSSTGTDQTGVVACSNPGSPC